MKEEDETEEILQHPGRSGQTTPKGHNRLIIVAVLALVVAIAKSGGRPVGSPECPQSRTHRTPRPRWPSRAGRTARTRRQGRCHRTPRDGQSNRSRVPDNPLVGTRSRGGNRPRGDYIVPDRDGPVGGRADVSVSGVADQHVALKSSYPLNTDSWRTVSVVTKPLGTGQSMTMKPYVTCGVPSTTSTTAPK